MKRTLLLLFLVIAIFACGTVKKWQVSEKMQQQSESNVELLEQNTLLQKEIVVFTDSSTHNYKLEILPKGNFSYHPLDGFDGQAEKVIVTGNTMQTPKLKKETMLNLEEKYAATHSTKDLIDYKLKIQQKEKQANRTIWFLITGILIIGLIWWNR